MVIDTSALVAILFLEPEAAAYAEAIEKAPIRYMAAPNVFEAAMVVEARKGPSAGKDLDRLMRNAPIEIIAFDSRLAEESRLVWRQFGKGNHPASLNFCDCCALALARFLDMPLLYKGQDFTRAKAASALSSRP